MRHSEIANIWPYRALGIANLALRQRCKFCCGFDSGGDGRVHCGLRHHVHCFVLCLLILGGLCGFFFPLFLFLVVLVVFLVLGYIFFLLFLVVVVIVVVFPLVLSTLGLFLVFGLLIVLVVLFLLVVLVFFVRPFINGDAVNRV